MNTPRILAIEDLAVETFVTGMDVSSTYDDPSSEPCLKAQMQSVKYPAMTCDYVVCQW
jgi:hypothetical protein